TRFSRDWSSDVCSSDLFAKVNARELLSKEEEAEYKRVKQRIIRICQACHQAGVRVLIDAEHSWIQDAIDDIAREMMLAFNREARSEERRVGKGCTARER